MDVQGLSHDDLVVLVEQQVAVLADLRAMVAAQQATITQLEQTVAHLERRLHEREAGGPPRGMPGHKPGPAPSRPVRTRRKRAMQFTRPRSTPTQQVVHALPTCPRCGTALAGGSVKRTREVIDLVLAPATITEHVY